jgi:DNA polymerase III sliding clamp (beta) subunit (PCNA family)
MEIILDKSEVARKLAITQGVVEKKSTVPILF